MMIKTTFVFLLKSFENKHVWVWKLFSIFPRWNVRQLVIILPLGKYFWICCTWHDWGRIYYITVKCKYMYSGKIHTQAILRGKNSQEYLESSSCCRIILFDIGFLYSCDEHENVSKVSNWFLWLTISLHAIKSDLL